jgi:hypothetical protein
MSRGSLISLNVDYPSRWLNNVRPTISQNPEAGGYVITHAMTSRGWDIMEPEGGKQASWSSQAQSAAALCGGRYGTRI